ncbi:unnamed protein product [Adineta ricciae]|uniref:Uncharacterized protein n=1 Tax=Adineta ricciae TaxID=249248 RepID=A0A815PCX8_ADIRI|nr:unnamed protein product [Adineta ricciae]CAF1637926.1 unnamed protein product [Adineta ricciae]
MDFDESLAKTPYIFQIANRAGASRSKTEKVQKAQQLCAEYAKNGSENQATSSIRPQNTLNTPSRKPFRYTKHNIPTQFPSITESGFKTRIRLQYPDSVSVFYLRASRYGSYPMFSGPVESSRSPASQTLHVLQM